MMGEIITDRVARFAAKITDEAATMDELMQRVSENESLAEVCTAWDIPFARMRAWIAASADREASYEAALRIKADGFVGEAVGIADNGELPVEDRKVRIATRFRAAAAYDRARFGDGTASGGIREIKIVIETTNGRVELPAIPGESQHVGTDTAIESV